MMKTDAFIHSAHSGADSADSKRQSLWLGALLVAVLAWLLYRNLGLNPAIFADEWYYSKMARLMPLSEAIVPSYLYLWLARGSLSCGTEFLDCVRVGNAVFFAGAGAFLYLVARAYLRPLLALLVTAMALLAPVNIYTAYFMPEATYYFGFAVLAWVALSPRPWTPLLRALIAGVVLGLMSLVKVHALFLMPAASLYLAANAWMARRDGAAGPALGMALACAVLAPALALGIKFGLGYLIAGESALSLFGSFYNATAAGSAPRSRLDLIAPALINGRGHLMALVILLALPLALLAHAIVSPTARREASPALKRLQLFAFLMLGSAAGMTIAYTASIVAQGPHEIFRLHLRYYSFAFPLLIILAATLLGRPAGQARPPLGWLVALPLAAVLLFALSRLPGFSTNPVDGPEISSIKLNEWTGWLVIGLDLAVLGLWAAGNRLAAPLFVFLAVPLMLVLGTQETNRFLAQLRPGWPTDHGARFARDYVPKAERNDITVATTGIQEVMRAQFHIDAPDTAMLDLPADAPIPEYQIPMRKKWLLVVGNHALPPGLSPVKQGEGYLLVRLPNATDRPLGTAHLSQPYGSGLLRDAEGMSDAEGFGRWSDAKRVVLHLNRPLPKQARVMLTAMAYGINTTLPFTMHVGEASKEFRLGPSPQEISLRFETDGTQRSLVIDVPQPDSPSTRGSTDKRKLGIGLTDITIADVGAAEAPAPVQVQAAR
ncbi:glycosyltransferase family 39 protein [Massilia sp. IC2-476]|uniref:ArnT family glycosyltransferase n=1 Tax=Massilia sp. IC2-476 TaxID=2887199 RepID=UPI001D1221A0|nr:hypothetical protein [Massilia sp. IC2-476]MCC2971153.1 hypothetical protein [Massilia sp. IC2-476]